MAVSEKEFESIVKYLREKLGSKLPVCNEVSNMVYNVIAEGTFEDWKVAHKPTRTKRVPATGELGEHWEKLWQLWPSLRSFEYNGRKFTYNKPFKTNEALCRQKWEKILQTKEVTPEELYNAAAVALAHCMAESYRKGRNEMEFHSGLLPWLNQCQYRNWRGMEMPQEHKEPTIYTEA